MGELANPSEAADNGTQDVQVSEPVQPENKDGESAPEANGATETETERTTEAPSTEPTTEANEVQGEPSDDKETEAVATETDTNTTEEPVVPVMDDVSVLEYLKQKTGKEIASLEDILKAPEPVDPYKGLDELTVQYLKYNKETGRNYDDFQKLQRDYTKISPLQAARLKAIEFSDGELTDSDVDDFLERELGIDLTENEELSKFDAIKIKAYGKDYIERQIADQEKYRKPSEPAPKGPEMVKLDNGMTISMQDYQKMEDNRQRYVDAIKNAADSITGSKFNIKVDDKGTEKAYDVGYDYSKEDKHRMVSDSLDVNKMVYEVSGSQKGGIDHAMHQENTWWYRPENREKAINSIARKLLAQWTEGFAEMRSNANFDTTKRMPGAQNGAQKASIPGLGNDYGVKYPLEQFKN